MASNDSDILNIRHYITEWSNDLEFLRQNNLMSESEFINFSKEAGLVFAPLTPLSPQSTPGACRVAETG